MGKARRGMIEAGLGELHCVVVDDVVVGMWRASLLLLSRLSSSLFICLLEMPE